MLLCRPIARQKERLYQSKLPGAPRGLQNWGQNAGNTPRIPGIAGHSANSLERARTYSPGHIRSSWSHTPVLDGQRYGPGRAPKSGTDDISSTSIVDRRCEVVKKSMSNCPSRPKGDYIIEVNQATGPTQPLKDPGNLINRSKVAGALQSETLN